jgi:3-dehydroquinate dehydratase / shikimate dehydrogenase
VLIQVILADTNEQLLRDYRAASPAADLLELRLDRVSDLNLAAIFAATGKPRVATCRSRSQGGFFSGTEEQRQRILRDSIRHGAEYVDLEFESGDEEILGSTGGARAILSYHLRGGTPGNLAETYQRMARRAEGAILKIIPFADSCTDNLRVRTLLREARSEGRPMIAFCMGEKGKVSRILSRAWGSWAVYAPSTPDAQTAPGQLLLSELTDVYRHADLDDATSLCGVLGHPVSESLSPLLHNAAYARRGLKRCFLPFDAEVVAEFLPLLSELPISGVAVTSPHKEAMVPHCDELDPTARRVGAVNTVVRKWNRLVGYNTDVEGGVAPLRRLLPLRAAHVGILGSGGAARALAFGLVREGSQVVLFGRNRSQAERVAGELGCKAQPWSKAGSFQGDVLINATPVGMRPGPDENPVSWDGIRTGLAYDLIYAPARTRFLREALLAGARVLGGQEMFLEQALLQFALLTGEEAPRDLFEELLQHGRSAHLPER